MLSVLFLNIQCTYLLLAPNRASLPGITACMGGIKKQVTELKQKNVYCRARDYLKDAYASSPLHVHVAIF
jgi:hypothetical protein